MRWVALLVFLAGCDAAPARVLSVTLAEDTRDPLGPYVVDAVLSGPLGGDHAVLCWNVDGADLGPIDMPAAGDRDDLRAAGIPGQVAGSTIGYRVLVRADVTCPALADVDALDTFRVLPSTLACEVDSQCRLGQEVCQDGTCRPFDGTCSGGACPGGTVCDDTRDPPLCVIAPRSCTADADCPALEECDPARGWCVARPACSADLPCPGDQQCDDTSGLCFRP